MCGSNEDISLMLGEAKAMVLLVLVLEVGMGREESKKRDFTRVVASEGETVISFTRQDM